jgi:outer membrane lipoprotein-sorting protein
VSGAERSRMGRVAGAALGLVAAAVLLGAGWGDSWEAIREAASAVRSVRADFVQEKRLPILTRPLRSEGSFSFRRPGSIRWEYESPVQSALLSDGREVRRFLKQGDAWVPESGAGMEAMRVVLDEISCWMAGRFDESETFSATLRAGSPTTIELLPRDAAMAEFVTRIVVTLAETPGAVAAIEIFEGETGSTRIEFRDMELNAELADALFTTVP